MRFETGAASAAPVAQQFDTESETAAALTLIPGCDDIGGHAHPAIPTPSRHPVPSFRLRACGGSLGGGSPPARGATRRPMVAAGPRQPLPPGPLGLSSYAPRSPRWEPRLWGG